MRSSGAPAKTGEPLYGSSVSSFLRPPMLKIEPALPMQRMLPALPMLRIEPALPMLKIEPALPMLKMEPALPMLSTLKILPTLPTLNKLPVPNKPAPLLAAPRATLRFRPERVALRIRAPLCTRRIRRSAYRCGRLHSTRSCWKPASTTGGRATRPPAASPRVPLVLCPPGAEATFES